MSRKLRTTIKIDRVYRSSKPHNGKETGVFYLIVAAHDGGLVTVKGYNPHAPQRKFCTRTIQAKSLAQYNLELVPYENEPEALMSEEGKAKALIERKRKESLASEESAEPQTPILAKDAVQIVLDLLNSNVQLDLTSEKIHFRGHAPGMVRPEHAPALRALKPLIMALLNRRPGWLDDLERDVKVTRKMVTDLSDALGIAKPEAAE